MFLLICFLLATAACIQGMHATGQNELFLSSPTKSVPTTVCQKFSLKNCQQHQLRQNSYNSEDAEAVELKELCASIKKEFYRDWFSIAIKLKAIVKDPKKGVQYLHKLSWEYTLATPPIDFKWNEKNGRFEMRIKRVKKNDDVLKKDRMEEDICFRSGRNCIRKDSVIYERSISPFQALLIIDWDSLRNCKEIVFDGFSFEPEDFYFLNKILDYFQWKYCEKKSETVGSNESLQNNQKKTQNYTDIDLTPNLNARFHVTFVNCIFFSRRYNKISNCGMNEHFPFDKVRFTFASIVTIRQQFYGAQSDLIKLLLRDVPFGTIIFEESLPSVLKQNSAAFNTRLCNVINTHRDYFADIKNKKAEYNKECDNVPTSGESNRIPFLVKYVYQYTFKKVIFKDINFFDEAFYSLISSCLNFSHVLDRFFYIDNCTWCKCGSESDTQSNTNKNERHKLTKDLCDNNFDRNVGLKLSECENYSKLIFK